MPLRFELYSMRPSGNNDSLVVSALSARSWLWQLLPRVEDEQHSRVIVKRGTPKAVLLRIHDYVPGGTRAGSA
jgi:prevent-host-death family protein